MQLQKNSFEAIDAGWLKAICLKKEKQSLSTMSTMASKIPVFNFKVLILKKHLWSEYVKQRQ